MSAEDLYNRIHARGVQAGNEYLDYCEKKLGKKVPAETRDSVVKFFTLGWTTCALGTDWKKDATPNPSPPQS